MPFIDVPFEVQKPQHGLRVDAYLAGRLPSYSRTQVQKLIDDGMVSLRGRPVKASSKVGGGDIVIVRYPKRPEPPCPHNALPVLYEDNDLVAIDKPANLLSHPTDKIVENTVTSIIKRQFGRPLHLAHRLDRDTSGVLVLAKNPASAKALYEDFVGRKVEKEYYALVQGKPSWKKKTADLPLASEGAEIRVRQAVDPDGAPAVTEFELLKAGEERSLVAARPKTGRLHQIRVHLAHLGHPIVGDRLYTGAGELFMKTVNKEITEEDILSLGSERQMLHARSLKLPGRPLIEAPVPPEFTAK
jgi:23S rRNA pseudouridine1911/1915/1917 synthase